MIRLPDRYYLTHFEEFLDYIRGPCAPLLDEQDEAFIHTFDRLATDSQCALVRIANRKSAFIAHSSMFYDEIDSPLTQVASLRQASLLSELQVNHVNAFLHTLTRPQLTSLLKDCGQQRGVSQLKKPQLLAHALHCVRETDVITRFQDEYSVRTFGHIVDYFLFLFFGNLRGALNRFSMRDLGVMKTRDDAGQQNARFHTRNEAKTAFHYATLDSALSDKGVTQQDLDNIATPPDAQGERAEQLKDRYFYQLGRLLLTESRQHAMSALALSNHPDATEKWLRERYKDGDKDFVEASLTKIIDEPESESLLAFAEDFLARKYKKKRTSVLTDWLRKDSQQIQIDERYRHQVERGVIDHYKTLGKAAYHTENTPWRALFGLLFWPELYERDDSALSNEFDRRPRLLVTNQFYAQMQPWIDKKLESITDLNTLMQQLSRNATQYFGRVTPLFHWHSGLLEQLRRFVTVLPLSSVKQQLRCMCEDYASFSDGYPDLLIIEHGKGHFEEVKAVGDQLRRNQLITIKKLKANGFDVRITQVDWCIEPDQPYAVVDIETTGGRAANHRITEIGIAKVVSGEVVDTWQTLLNPQRHIPANITRLTGIDNAMVADAPVFADICDELRHILDGCIFVAHNVNFDYGFIKQEFARLEQHFSMPKLCTVREMRKAVPGLSSYSLANLTEHFAIDMQRHHRAMSDALAAAGLLNIINQKRCQTT
ncbi:exonuclease domain-containing protein [Aestuariibacter salexigens]|uniref:exonuclease domain-containing protein n=1 Tax=Aestuariibacter salexigens TaxID=226010 RepID=UPI0004037A46|nr:exonuclease domain-containing protein [Aestuariibacter salexigens]